MVRRRCYCPTRRIAYQDRESALAVLKDITDRGGVEAGKLVVRLCPSCNRWHLAPSVSLNTPPLMDNPARLLDDAP